MRIGVVADTHMPRRASVLPEAVLQGLQGVDLILHAGDLTDSMVLVLLEALAPVIAVAGNNDPRELALPLTQEIEVGRFRIGLTHGHEGKGRTTPERARSLFAAVDCVIFGHSHTPFTAWQDGVLLFNPGSPTDRRRAPRCSYGILHVTEGALIPTTFYL